MGVLYARVAGAWVPISASGPGTQQAYVISPAEAGPRIDNAGMARFGHISADDRAGFSAYNEGSLQAVAGNGKLLALYQINAAGTGYDYIGQFGYAMSIINTVGMGVHPSSGMSGIWINTGNGAAQAHFVMDGNYVIINAQNNGVYLRKAGANMAQFGDSNNINFYAPAYTQTLKATGQIDGTYDTVSGSWTYANLSGHSTSGHGARLCLHATYAPQLRCHPATGEKFAVVTQDAGAFAPIAASAFEVNSTLTAKRHVRPLRVQPESVTVHHPPVSDTVPEPDIMALRPVAFRPKTGPPMRVSTDGLPVEEPADTFIGRQATRERLGLIAEEVQHVIPSAVAHDAEGAPYAIDYAQITVALLDHVQALTDEVATLRYRITELEGAA